MLSLRCLATLLLLSESMFFFACLFLLLSVASARFETCRLSLDMSKWKMDSEVEKINFVKVSHWKMIDIEFVTSARMEKMVSCLISL